MSRAEAGSHVSLGPVELTTPLCLIAVRHGNMLTGIMQMLGERFVSRFHPSLAGLRRVRSALTVPSLCATAFAEGQGDFPPARRPAWPLLPESLQP